MSDLRISPLPQVASKRSPVLDQASTQRHDYGFGTPAATGPVDTEMAGLVKGLASLNPALEGYGQEQAQTQALDARQVAIANGLRMQMEGISEKELLGQPLPSSIHPAFDNAYRSGLKSVLGDRAASSIKDTMAREYALEKDKPEFDLGTFLNDSRSKHMAGFMDPEMSAKVGHGVSQIEVAIRSDVEKKRMVRQAEMVDASFTQVVRDKLDPRGTPDALYETYQNDILPEAMRLNKSPKDAAKFLFTRIEEMSNKLGGSPELFDVFDKKDSAGMALSSRNPELSGAIDGARKAAKHMLESKLIQDGQENRFKDFIALDAMRDANPASITPAMLSPRIGKFELFPTAEAAHSYLRHAQAETQQRLGLESLREHWDGNNMSRLPPKEQQDVMEAYMGPAMNGLFKVAAGGQPEEVASLAHKLIKEASTRNVSVPIPAMERFIDTLSTTIQNKAGPDAGFLAKAQLYKQLSISPAIQAMYFKGDTADLMETFTKQTATGGSDPKAAYSAAYESVSKESKAAAVLYAKTPEFAKASKAAVDKVIGSSMLPQWLFGSGRPGNPDAVNADASAAMLGYLRTHPAATHEQVNAFAKSYVADNWIHDETSGAAIKVPTAFANPTTQENLSEFSKRILKQGRLTELQGDWRVEYRPKGTEGDIDVVLTNGAGSMTPLARTTLGAINQQFFNEKHIDHSVVAPGGVPSEGMKLTELKRQLDSGQVDPTFIAANQPLIAKARILKALRPPDMAKLDQMQDEQNFKQLRGVPKMSLGTPDNSSLSNIKQRGSAVVDTKATASLAKQFAATSQADRLDSDKHGRALAASLVTVGEGVVTHAYDDPAQGAGRNIGTGYNLKANAENAPADLRRAGVPAGSVQGVLEGTLQMTSDQVSRLTQVSIQKYAEIAKGTAEKSAPGLWARMTAPQKAVMIDLAYQVGSVDKYKNAWKALAAGDEAGFAANAVTTYVNRAGERVVDKRRNSLRASMLAGSSTWDATVNKYGSYPSTALDVASLNSN